MNFRIETVGNSNPRYYAIFAADHTIVIHEYFPVAYHHPSLGRSLLTVRHYSGILHSWAVSKKLVEVEVDEEAFSNEMDGVTLSFYVPFLNGIHKTTVEEIFGLPRKKGKSCARAKRKRSASAR